MTFAHIKTHADPHVTIGDDFTVRGQKADFIGGEAEGLILTIKETTGPVIKIRADDLEEAISRLKTILESLPSDAYDS